MSKVRHKNTGPELIVRKALRSLGIRYSLHSHKLPGTPDIVIRSKRISFFIHGCFWHRHVRCKYATTPKSNQSFWINKFSANIDRDKRVAKQLKKLGWSIITIWQCQTKDIQKLRQKLATLLSFHTDSAPSLILRSDAKNKYKEGRCKKKI
jgi:DNA mismatch endonuclease (patch repair protein)